MVEYGYTLLRFNTKPILLYDPVALVEQRVFMDRPGLEQMPKKH